MILSICIPNYNRSASLENCLNSIKIAKNQTKLKFEVCISDNNSEENITIVDITYKLNLKNKKNYGMGQNIYQLLTWPKENLFGL